MMFSEETSSVETWHIRVTGRVQGVSYRDSSVQYATANGVRGWVRNHRDGSVELMLQGSPSATAAMRKWLQHDVPHAQVTELKAEPLDQQVERFDSFRRYRQPDK
jgi:acylphosphatase